MKTTNLLEMGFYDNIDNRKNPDDTRLFIEAWMIKSANNKIKEINGEKWKLVSSFMYKTDIDTIYINEETGEYAYHIYYYNNPESAFPNMWRYDTYEDMIVNVSMAY